MTTPLRLDVGDIAPDFTLPDQHGDPVRLGDLRGEKVILYFYGQASTPACTKQACDFRDRLDVFRAARYRVIGISRDEVPAQERFAREEELTFPVLADPDRRVHDLYGAFGEKKLYGKVVNGVIRSTFVIDEEGRIEQALYNIRATGHVAMLSRRLGLAA